MGGGGSGGSVYIRTGTLTGSGTIRANGGNGGTGNYADSGGGSGGRIAIHYTADEFSGTVEAKGGTDNYEGTPGQAGTVGFFDVSDPLLTNFVAGHSWRFEPQDLHYRYVLLRDKNAPSFTPSNPKTAVLRKLWTKMPLWAVRRVSDSLAQYLP